MWKKYKGFSLLEVMVALSILALAVSTLLVIRNNSIEQASRAREARRLNILLDLKMGEIIVGIEKRRGGVFEDEGYENYVWSSEIQDKKISSSSPTDGKIYEVLMKKAKVTIRHKNAPNIQGTLESYFLAENPEDVLDEKSK